MEISSSAINYTKNADTLPQMQFAFAIADHFQIYIRRGDGNEAMAATNNTRKPYQIQGEYCTKEVNLIKLEQWFKMNRAMEYHTHISVASAVGFMQTAELCGMVFAKRRHIIILSAEWFDSSWNKSTEIGIRRSNTTENLK